MVFELVSRCCGGYRKFINFSFKRITNQLAIKDIIIKEATSFEMPGNIAPNPELAKALQERFWLPQIRTTKEALDWLNQEVGKFPKIGEPAKRFLI